MTDELYRLGLFTELNSTIENIYCFRNIIRRALILRSVVLTNKPLKIVKGFMVSTHFAMDT